jgi:hypothetical protein
MTIYQGRLLFDTPEPTINNWENQLGYRGYIEVWKRGEQTLTMDCDDDVDPDVGSWEVRVDDWPGEGQTEYIAFGTFAECDKAAKEWMSEN